ncbi:MAG TPA: hypothetical protein VNT75_11780 [Symbiobacteriaceae bacterium]|nr:hypothetical protein [Symbiobacteriaceae bacterium]
MSTSVTNNRLWLRTTALVYGGVSVFTVAANSIYGLYAHGVSSPAMTFMFLYPLVGGVGPALLLWVLAGRGARVPRSRVAFNLYNAGIATLTVASFLQGVFEIAGTASDYTVVIRVLGAGLVAGAVIAALADR